MFGKRCASRIFCQTYSIFSYLWGMTFGPCALRTKPRVSRAQDKRGQQIGRERRKRKKIAAALTSQMGMLIIRCSQGSWRLLAMCGILK
jgi:hypothetical protein